MRPPGASSSSCCWTGWPGGGGPGGSCCRSTCPSTGPSASCWSFSGGTGPGGSGGPCPPPSGWRWPPWRWPCRCSSGSTPNETTSGSPEGALLVVLRKFPGTASLGLGPPSRLPCDAFPTEKVAAETLENGLPAATFGTPGWIRTSGLPLRSTAYHFVNCSYHIFPCCFFANCAAWRQVNLHKFP